MIEAAVDFSSTEHGTSELKLPLATRLVPRNI